MMNRTLGIKQEHSIKHIFYKMKIKKLSAQCHIKETSLIKEQELKIKENN
jgi:hypothetical protein